MDARRATLLVMAKMALSDGTVSDEERGFLKEVTGSESVDDLLTEAKGLPIASLVKDVDAYADRFFIALRAASMAAIDAHFDAREEALYDKLVALLKITKKDRELITETVEAESALQPTPPHPRVHELFMQSSFASAS